MRKKNLWLGGICLITLSLVLASCTSEAAEPGKERKVETKAYEWRLVQHNPRGQLHWPGLEMTGKLAEGMSGGRLKITQFAGGELIKAPEIFDSVSKGVVEMAITDLGYYTGTVPIFSIETGLPMGPRTVEDLEMLWYKPGWNLEELLRAECAKKNVYYVGPLWGTPYIINSKVPIKKLADFKGLKIRTIGSVAKMLEKAGASLIYVPGEEIYSSLATGVFSAFTSGGAMGAYGMKGHEICKYLLLTPMMPKYSNAVIVNMDAWKKLPPDLQAILQSAARHGCLIHQQWTMHGERDAVVKMQKEHGVTLTELPPEDVAKLTKLAMEVWDGLAKADAASAEAIKRVKEFMAWKGYLG